MGGINTELFLESMKQFLNGNFTVQIHLDSSVEYTKTDTELATVFNTLVSSSKARQDDLDSLCNRIITKGDFSARMNTGDSQGKFYL